jgi:hypothetical protein
VAAVHTFSLNIVRADILATLTAVQEITPDVQGKIWQNPVVSGKALEAATPVYNAPIL